MIIILAYLASRALALMAGLRFDSGLVPWAWQLLDVELLRGSPVESIFWLHSQPPLFNMVTAALLRLPDWLANPAALVLWNAMSLIAALALYASMRQLHVRRPIAVTMVVLFVVSPASLLYSNWYFYSEPVVLLLALALLFISRFSYTLRASDLLGATAALTALSLTKASYHPLLVAGLLAAFWAVRRCTWQRAYLLALLPLVVTMGWSVKNAALFGSYSNSTWLGMNIAKQYNAAFTAAEQRALVEEGVIDQAPLEFGPVLNEDSGVESGSFGAPATDAWFKANGQPNYNNTAYIERARQSRGDVLTAFRHHPSRYLRSQLAAHVLWLQPADGYFFLFLRENRTAIDTYADWFDRLVLVRLGNPRFNSPEPLSMSAADLDLDVRPFWQEALIRISWTKLAMYVLAIVGGVATIRRVRRSGDRRPYAAWTFAFAIYGVLMVASNALEFGENMRFGYESMPALLLLSGIGLEAVVTRLARPLASI